MEAWPNFDTEPGSGTAAADRRCPGRLAGECRPWCQQAVGLAVRCRSADPWLGSPRPWRVHGGWWAAAGRRSRPWPHRPAAGSRTGPPPATARRRSGRPAVRGHQHPLGLLDQPAMLQGGLQLAGQPPLDLGGDGGAEQAGHQPAWACRARPRLGPNPAAGRRGCPGCRSPHRPTPPLQQIADSAKQLFAADGLADAGRRRGAAALGQRVGPDAQAVEDGQERLAQGPCAVAFSQRLPAAIRNIKLEPDWQEFTQVLVGEGICAALSVPSGPGPVLGPGCPGRRCFWPGRWDRSASRCLPFWYLGDERSAGQGASADHEPFPGRCL